MNTSETRRAQLFPTLSATQLESARRFASGAERSFAPGERVYDIGERNVPAWLVLKGSIIASQQGGTGREAVIVVHGPGQMSGETAQLSGRAGLTSARAGDAGALAVPFDAAHLRALIIGSADVGETIMRAFILRRVALIEAGQAGEAGPVLVGARSDPDLVRLSGFMTRNSHPHTVLATCEPEGRELIRRLGVLERDLPLMICPDGTMLKRPSDQEAAACLGMMPSLEPDRLYDVAVIGAGPAGLATAVYAASEGLSVLVCDERSYGGQAGASARIENYLGFPTGITGQALAGRAFAQATKFGAELAIPLGAIRLECGDETRAFALHLDNGQSATARTVVVASGARYRRPDVANLGEVEGAGVSFWATSIEARLCRGEEVALVGGGNSAGQAVVFLAGSVAKLHLFVRRPLHETMSHYLVERIAALPNVELHVGTEIVGLEGDRVHGLTGAVFVDRRSGAAKHCALRHLFLFIGAEPNTAWLSGKVALDDKGFVVTGSEAGPGRLLLETSRRGIFAVGDVRAGSTKRVAAAVGEGAAAVAQIHGVLA
ncbi:FAD-dependent oxidoreductase [Acuticoccus mangrovi]|uniref:Thioredoxin reductase n=1 Tax=Acuticoccus mangrovi TaxID=2796142 RepID=A0A934ILF4_9HYPH|nr:FAD-dependent oxidoreductase [Acuticoccus mangrovi]MBJ3777121.1 FAD-dependent oxidoreductase [Acuticoccus mangrovi]